MPGKHITNQQVEIYMSARKQGFTQSVSAAKSGISERSGRDLEHGKQNEATQPRHWRTRPDPFDDVWNKALIPLLEESPELTAITLFEYLQQKYVGLYPDSQLRTLQRRVKQWKAVNGPEKEVMFRQEHPPGRQGLSDFTHLKGVVITIKGQALKHLLYHFRLAFSKWSYLKVILGGESFTAFAEGLQEALWRLGACPHEHRTDSLSAAYKNLNKDEQADVTERYATFCQHYGMQATRNNVGKGHENGSVESSHGHLKRRIEQALILRCSYDFESVEAYQQFIDQVVKRHNQRNSKALLVELPHLNPLPKHKTVDFTELNVRVSSSSTIDVRRVTYSVPSRLEGERLRIHLYHDRLECYLGSTHVIALLRVYPTQQTTRARNIDYRHLIHSLIKKPQAFRLSVLRDDLLPNENYKKIWRYVEKNIPGKAASKFIVGLLHIAATQDCEDDLARDVLARIAQGKTLSLSAYQWRRQPSCYQGRCCPIH